MFEFIRNHKRLMQFLLLLLIIPSFGVVGLQSYSHFGDSADTVAKVGRQPISQHELDSALRYRTERVRQMLGDQFDSKMLETPQAKQEVLDSLITQQVLAAAASKEKISISDQTLQKEILSVPELLDAQGKFDNERYRSLLAMQGMTPPVYEARLRQDLALQQFNNAVQTTAFVPKTVATHLVEITQQEREVQALLFKPSDYLAQVNVTESMLQDYYKKNAKEFEIPEQVKAEYIVLDSAAAAAQVVVNEAEVKSYYDQHLNRYSRPEERRASHILITLKKDATPAEQASAKTKIENLLAQVHQNPSAFAQIAKANSQDTASAELGGDLGYFGAGTMVKPFDDAVKKLKKGEISNIVQSDFGYHIIELTDIKPEHVEPFDTVKTEITAELQKQMTARKFTELAETFNNMVYEQADSLKPVAEKMHLQIQTVDHLGRLPNPAIAPTVGYNHRNFLNALFSDETLKSKRNTEAIEVAPELLIAGRVLDYKPVSQRAFADVRKVVQEKVLHITAQALAVKAGTDKLQALKAQDNPNGFGQNQIIARHKQGEPQVVEAVMKADINKLPSYVGVNLSEQGYEIYRINKIIQPPSSDQSTQQQHITDIFAQQEMLAYTESLKEKAKVKILKPVLSDTDQ